MSTGTQPTFGAMRAAEVITPYTSDRPPYHMINGEVRAARVAEIAAIIDRETAAPQLLAACQWFVGQCQGDSGTGESYWEEFAQYRAARAAIAAATKGAQ